MGNKNDNQKENRNNPNIFILQQGKKNKPTTESTSNAQYHSNPDYTKSEHTGPGIILPDPRGWLQNSGRWLATNAQYAWARGTYYCKSYLPTWMTSWSMDAAELELHAHAAKVAQRQADLQELRDQRSLKLAENLNKGHYFLDEKQKIFNTWYGASQESLDYEFEHSTYYPNYESSLELEDFNDKLCSSLSCTSKIAPPTKCPESQIIYKESEPTIIYRESEPKIIYKDKEPESTGLELTHTSNYKTQREYREIKKQLSLVNSENAKYHEEVEYLTDELLTCQNAMINEEYQKMNQQSQIANTAETESKKKDNFITRWFFKGNDKSENTNQYLNQMVSSYDSNTPTYSPEGNMLNGNQQKLSREIHETARLLINVQNQKTKGPNLLKRGSNYLTDRLTRAIINLMTFIFVSVISLTITIWVLTWFRVLILKGLEELKGRKKAEQNEEQKDEQNEEQKDKTKRREKIAETVSVVGQYIGPIANFIKVIRGGALVPLSNIPVSEITYQELEIMTDPVTHIIKRQQLIKKFKKLHSIAFSKRKIVGFFVADPITESFNKVVFSKEILLVLSFGLVLQVRTAPVTSTPIYSFPKNHNLQIQKCSKSNTRIEMEQKINKQKRKNSSTGTLIQRGNARIQKKYNRVKKFSDLVPLKRSNDAVLDSIIQANKPESKMRTKISIKLED